MLNRLSLGNNFRMDPFFEPRLFNVAKTPDS